MKTMKQSLGTSHCKLETDKCLEIKRTLIDLGCSLHNFTYIDIPNLQFRHMHCDMYIVPRTAKKFLF